MIQGSSGPLYRCDDGHGYTSQSLLTEQAKLAARILRDIEASLESHLALSAELVLNAREEEQPHLVRYLERVLDAGRETLGFVQARLREDDPPI